MGTETDQSQSWILLCRLALCFPFMEALTAPLLPGWLTPEAVSNSIVACRTLGGLEGEGRHLEPFHKFIRYNFKT